MEEWDQYELLYKLGEGRYGTVTRARHKKLGSLVALKSVLQPSEEQTNNEAARSRLKLRKTLHNEARVLAALNHPCVVALVEVCIGSNGEWTLALEDLGHTSLSSAVRENNNEGLCESLVGCVALHMARALGYLHSRGFLHRDVKPDNIMLEKINDCHTNAKLIDLGLSVNFNDEKMPCSSITRAGTVSFMAPELMSPNVFYGPQVDFFGLGASLYFALIGQEAFNAYTTTTGCRSSTSIFGIQAQHEDMLEELSSEVADVIRGMLLHDPSQRWQEETILGSIWLRQSAVYSSYVLHVNSCLPYLNDWLMLNKEPHASNSLCHKLECTALTRNSSVPLESRSSWDSFSSIPSCFQSSEYDSSEDTPSDTEHASSNYTPLETPSTDALLVHTGNQMNFCLGSHGSSDDENVSSNPNEDQCACYDIKSALEETTVAELARVTREETSVVKNKIEERPWGKLAGMYNLLRLRGKQSSCELYNSDSAPRRTRRNTF